MNKVGLSPSRKLLSGTRLQYTKKADCAKLERGTDYSAGIDLAVRDDALLSPGESRLFSTGIRVAIPRNHFGMVVIRSGVAAKTGLRMTNGIGIIDSDYRGDIGLLLENRGGRPEPLIAGQRVAQLIIVPYAHLDPVDVEGLSFTGRGGGGFGSTGE